VVVVGAGITGLVTSYYLTRDPNNLVTLIEKSSVSPEESGFDAGVFNPGVV
jgi:glycine/D-amino acid oxidase-like deaminating enzyme